MLADWRQAVTAMLWNGMPGVLPADREQAVRAPVIPCACDPVRL